MEIGFGSGLNVPFYPAAVTRVAAVEPADAGWRLAKERVRESPVPVERSGLDGQTDPSVCRRARPRNAIPGAPAEP